MDGTGRLFGPLVRALDTSRLRPRVFAYDERAASYDALLEALPRPSGPTIVLGESFGGPLAVCLARRDRELVKALVLVASFVRAPQPFLRAATITTIAGPHLLAQTHLTRVADLLAAPPT